MSKLKSRKAKAVAEKATDAAEKATKDAGKVADSLSDSISHLTSSIVPLVSEGGRELGTKAADAYATYSPKVTEKLHEGLDAAQAKVDQYAAQASPKIQEARERVVSDYVPRAQKTYQAAGATANAAAAAALDAARKEWEHNKDDIVSAATTPTPIKKKKSGFGRFLLFVGIAGVAGGIAYLLWKRSQPVEDPWAPPADFARAHYPAAGSTDSDTEEVSDSVAGAEAGDVATSLDSSEDAPKHAADPAESEDAEAENKD